MLSQLLLLESPAYIPTPGETILLLDMSFSLPVTAANLKQYICCDVIQYCLYVIVYI